VTRRGRGYTLFEVVFALAIFGMFLFTGLVIFLNILFNRSRR